MSAFAQPRPEPHFPTRFPRPPRLALVRRREASGDHDPGEFFPFPAPAPGDAERLARQIELALALRERAVSDAESRLAERVRDLDELEALLRAREALLTAARLRDPGGRGVVTRREADALNQLKGELDRQESGLRETRQALSERELFLERSEAQLFAKVQEQQERETELDQREENLLADERRLQTAPGAKPAAPSAKRLYDEFRE